jgi:predicted  nucleic acid-binding Zn-ribbon protein
MTAFHQEEIMAKKSRLTKVATSIGAAVGRADRTAHKLTKAGLLAKKELDALAKDVAQLKKRLEKATGHLRHALK